MDPMFRALLVQRRRQQLIAAKGKAVPVPKVPVAKYPVLLERKYAAWIMRLLQPLATVSNAWAKNEYPKILEAYQKQDSADHMDADSFSLILSLTDPMAQAQTEMDLETGGSAARTIAGTAESVNVFVAKRYAMERRIALGSVYEISEPWVNSSLAEWTETNRRLIKSLATEAQTRMETMVLEAVQTGVRPEELVSRIYNLNRSTGIARAKLIAADQVGKLTGLLVEKRSLAIGMDTYTWQTAMDERVRGRPDGLYPSARPSHWAAQGKIGIFGKGDVWLVGGNQVSRGSGDPIGAPGFEIRCFLGNREVASHVPAQMLYRHRYSGKGSILTTNTGEALRCTANHPILRADGVMVPAHLLNKGDKIIQFGTECFDPVSLDAAADKQNQDCVSFEEFFDLCQDLGGSGKRRGAREDFHGDGSTEDVDVIDLERGLPDGVHLTGIDQGIAKHYLAKAYARLVSEVPTGDAFPEFPGDRDPSQSLMAGLRKFLPFLGRKSAHSEEIRLRSIAALDSMLLEDTADYKTSDSIFLAQLEFARSGLVPSTDLMFRKILSLVPCSVLDHAGVQSIPTKVVVESRGTASDALGNVCQRLTTHGAVVEIVDVGTCEISAHVFNLQNADGWYCVKLDNGKYTIVSNCRCIASSRWEDVFKPIDEELLSDPWVLAEMGKGPWPGN